MDSTKADRLGIRARGQRWCGPDELPAGDTVAWAQRTYHDKAMEMGWDDTSTKGKGNPLNPNTIVFEGPMGGKGNVKGEVFGPAPKNGGGGGGPYGGGKNQGEGWGTVG